MQTGGQTYWYVTNLQGDVTAILNAAGNAVVTYTYDAWGNILEIGGEDANTLGRTNPLRYRGYVYDQETGLYYLQSRYYDPEMGRFISADAAYIATGQGLTGNNRFAYCGNNPVVNTDISGTMHERTAGGAVCGGGRSNGQKMTWNKELEEFLLHMAREREEGCTFSAGFSGGNSWGGILHGASGVLSVDSSSNYALQKTRSTGVAPGLGASGGLIMTYTNATNVQDLAGDSDSNGVTLVSGLGISIDYITFTPKSNPNRTCWGVSVTLSVGGEAEVHSAVNSTESSESWNPFIALKEYLFGA